MIEIRSINDFLQLSEFHRSIILKELKTKIRLEDWLRALNDKKKRVLRNSKTFRMACRKCEGKGDIVIVPRDGRDVHPSQIHKCLKKIWFDCNDVVVEREGVPTKVPYAEFAEEYIDPRLRMIFDMGHAWHDTMQGYGAKGAWCPKKSYRSEVEIDPDKKKNGQAVHPMAEAYWIRGSADAVLDLYVINIPGLGEIGIRLIHEYKTINSNGYGRLTKPKSDHKWQATIYSVALDVPVVVYIYTNKDNCQLADFPISFDVMLWKKIEEKIEKVQYYTEQEGTPPWEETSAVLSPRDCTECPYQKLCNPPQAEAKRSRRR